MKAAACCITALVYSQYFDVPDTEGKIAPVREFCYQLPFCADWRN
jgi:hypothetical protein